MRLKNVRAGMEMLEPLESRQLLAADLTFNVGTIGYKAAEFVPNNTVRVPVTVQNTGDAASAAGARVVFFLSSDTTLDGGDVRLGGALTLPAIGAGQSNEQTFRFVRKFVVDTASSAGRVAQGDYHVIAKLENAGSDTAEAASADLVSYDYRFGNVDGRSNVTLIAIGDGGHRIQFRLTGPGTGMVRYENGGMTVETSGSRYASHLTISGMTTNTGTPTIERIDVRNSLGSLRVERANLTGAISFVGSFRNLFAENASDLAISVSGVQQIKNIRLNNVEDSSIVSNASIKNLIVNSWQDTDSATDRIAAPWMNQVRSTGDFGASLALPGVGAPTSPAPTTLNFMNIGGALKGDVVVFGGVEQIAAASMDGSRILVSGALRFLNIGGKVLGSTVAATSIRRVDIGNNVLSSHFAAGATFDQGVVGDVLEDFTDVSWTGGTLRNVTIGGTTRASTFTAAVDPTNEVWLDGDDAFAGAGTIRNIHLKGQLFNSKFVGTSLPVTVKIANANTPTAGDARFATTL